MPLFNGQVEKPQMIGRMGVVFGLIYWVIESFMDAYVYDLGPLVERVLRPDLNEFMMRILAVALILALGLYAQFMIDRVRRIEKRLARLNECFLSFGADPVANIDRLTGLCGELLGADAARYARLEQGKFCSWGQFRWPCDCDECSEAEGHLCFDALRKGGAEPYLIRNLPSSPYAKTETALLRHGFQTYLGRAVQLGDRDVGTLCTVFRRDFLPGVQDERILGIIASAIGVEEVRRQAQQALRSSESRLKELSAQLLTAQETERKHIALQMHDSIGQSLSAVKFSIEETLERLRHAVPPETTRPLETAVPLIQEVVNEVRRIQRNLRPAMLDDLGILATLGWFCRDFQSIYKSIQVDLELGVEEVDIPEPLKIVLFRIVQEAFNNVAKHSRASRVRLALGRSSAGAIALEVEDDGRGFDVNESVSHPESRGIGLSSIRERAELSGGLLRIESTMGGGVRIRVLWPGRPEKAGGEAPDDHTLKGTAS